MDKKTYYARKDGSDRTDKFKSARKHKRKGFSGIRPQEKSNIVVLPDENDDNVPADVPEAGNVAADIPEQEADSHNNANVDIPSTSRDQNISVMARKQGGELELQLTH